MKWIGVKIGDFGLLILLFAFVLCLGSNIFAQPETNRKRANKSLADGKKLSERETENSHKEAIRKFQDAYEFYKKTGDKNGQGKALYETALIFQKLGKRAEALENYKKAYELFRSTSNRLWQAKTLNFIGVIYSSLGDKKKALGLYNSALSTFYRLDAFGEAIPTINNIGSMYQEFGDQKTALFYFNLALPYVREINDKGREAMILLNIGDVYSDAGNQQKAIEYFKKSLPLHQAVKNKAGEVRTLNQLGVSNLRTQQNRESLGYLNRAVAINGSRFKNDEALSLNYLMHAWKRLGKERVAIFFGKQSIDKYQNLRRGIRGLNANLQKKYLKTIEDTYRTLADLLIKQGLFAQAKQVLEMLKEEEFLKFVQRDADEIKSLKNRVKLSRKEKDLLARYSSFAASVTAIGKRFAELDNKKRQKKDLSKNERKRYETFSKQLRDSNTAFNLFLEKQLAGELGEKVIRDIEYDKSLQEKLRRWNDGTVTLYTVITKDRYRVILTTPTVQVDGKTEIKATDLNKKIFAYREALQNLEIDPRPKGKELYDILIKPIEKDLRAAGAKTLVWSLDGTLRYIPFATLSPDGKSYLNEKYQNVIITPKTRDDLSDVRSEWRALGVGVSKAQTIPDPGDPEQTIEFSPIPGTIKELESIVRDENNPTENGILSGRRFIDIEFTLGSFLDSLSIRSKNGKRKYTIVHVASHFQLGKTWNDSFLLLGGGKTLTLEKITNSSKLDFTGVELVTLSACDTAFIGNSNGKEIDSLADAIQAKNGKAVLATLWAVVDKSTPLLMTEFYRLQKENPKMTKADSIRKVQNEFISGKIKPDENYIQKLAQIFGDQKGNLGKEEFVFDKNKPFAHPFFWSPFVLIGNWR